MSDTFTMDSPQPRLLDQDGSGHNRHPDGPPRRASESLRAGPVYRRHCDRERGTWRLVRATITRGRVTHIHRDSVKSIAGVIDVITDPRMIRNPAQGMAGEAPVQPVDAVHYYGQPIALVVAESFEAAQDAAAQLVVHYETEVAAATPDGTPNRETADPETAGNFDAAWDAAEVKIDLHYTTPSHAASAMEPHAAIAEWNDGALTLRSSLQMIRFNKAELADTLGIDPEKVRILSPFVGGGFGSKLGLGPEAVAAAIASQKLDRPVRVVMTRQNVFDCVLRRSETAQRVRFGATKDGRITAISHDDTVSNLDGEKFSEPVSQASQFLYGADGLSFTQTVAYPAMTPAGSVRAPEKRWECWGSKPRWMNLQTAWAWTRWNCA